MFDMTGSIQQAMGLILAITNRVGLFGIVITAWIVILFGFEWTIAFIQRLIKTVFPGVSFQQDQDQALQDAVDFNNERDDLAEQNWRDGVFDLENEDWEPNSSRYS
jgi:hypothetical protein